jgi:hypothetical protein
MEHFASWGFIVACINLADISATLPFIPFSGDGDTLVNVMR